VQHARLLADLLDSSRDLADDMNQLGKHFFVDEEWNALCEELGYEAAGTDLLIDDEIEFAKEQGRRAALGLPMQPEPDYAPDPEADARFETEAKGWSEWFDLHLNKALRFASLSSTLRQLALGCTNRMQNPPFATRGSDSERRVARLTDSLHHLFHIAFRRPLDEVVATIVEVVTGNYVSPVSLKMRRMRLRKHDERRIR